MIPRNVFASSLAWVFVILVSFSSSLNVSSAEKHVQITELGGKLDIKIGNEPFTQYHFENVSRPFLYPILGPGQAPMTRNWPMKEAANEERDHPHHRSLWYAHGDVNGHDFWSESEKAGKTLHEKFTELKSGLGVGVVKSLNKLVAKDGKTIATDERTIRIYATPDDRRMLDYEITIHASNGELTFGDTKEGTMAIRLAETMRLKGKVGSGHIVNSEGIRDGQTWGKRAKWCDYYGPVDGSIVGVAIFDHPQNPRHPTWWHVRDYGLFAANPFGIHDFEKLPDKTKGNLVVPTGQSVTFRYRFLFHKGDEKEGKVADYYQDYVKTVSNSERSK